MAFTATSVMREANALRDPARAKILSGFFRTGPGDYGEGDKFLGLTVPQSRLIAKAFRDLPLDELAKLLASPWHEHRLIALHILVDQFQRAGDKQRLKLHRFYIANLAGVNNWDLVDTSASALAGQHLPTNPRLLRRLITSKNLWHRRIAIVSTFAELKQGRSTLTFSIAGQLLADPHDLMHKAVGWLLREAGKRDQPALLAFLRAHYPRLPRTTLRYAIERLDPLDRKLWLAGPQ